MPVLLPCQQAEEATSNVRDMEKVDCEFCGGIFLVAQAVVLDDDGEFRYCCSRDCAFGRLGMRSSITKPTTKSTGWV
jgi:alpha-D-ribose 1-methylphosphonate 5-phosphate C-P lyase